MNELIKWLAAVEEMAAAVYRGVARVFIEDESICSFAEKLAKEEEWHFNGIRELEEDSFLASGRELAITVDEDAKAEIEGYFKRLEEAIKRDDLTRGDVLKYIVEAEFSEWNDIFLYVIKSCSANTRECQELASSMGRHKKEIEKFISGTPYCTEEIERLINLPSIWENKILIVEDDEAVRDIMMTIMRKAGKAESASNGREGLEKMKENYFDLVISDIDMPGMDGLEMYREAVRFDQDLGNRIIFFTGTGESRIKDFLVKNRLKYITKPSTMKKIREASATILRRSPMQ